MVLILNSYTRWAYEDLMDMTTEELAEWLESTKEVYKAD